MNANKLLQKKKPPNWSDQDELVFREAVDQMARQERNPYSPETFPEFQQSQLESREADAKYGYGTAQRMDKEVDDENVNHLISQILKRKKF